MVRTKKAGRRSVWARLGATAAGVSVQEQSSNQRRLQGDVVQKNGSRDLQAEWTQDTSDDVREGTAGFRRTHRLLRPVQLCWLAASTPVKRERRISTPDHTIKTKNKYKHVCTNRHADTFLIYIEILEAALSSVCGLVGNGVWICWLDNVMASEWRHH